MEHTQGSPLSYFTHCQECGQKLDSAFFCRPCGRSFCSLECRDRHTARHGMKTPLNGTKPTSKSMAGVG